MADEPTSLEVDLRMLPTEGDPFAFWDSVREDCAFFRTEPGADAGEDIWAFTRFEEIREAHRNTDLLSNKGIFGAPYLPAGQRKFGFVEMDPPEHHHWRQALAPFFAPVRIEKLVPEMEEWASSLIDELAERGECDFVAEVARLYPTTIFLGLMGTPIEDRERLCDLGYTVTHMTLVSDPDGSKRAAAMAEIEGYFEAVIADRRRQPRDDFVSALVAVADSGTGDEVDLLGTVVVVFFGGIDTIAATLGHTFHHLATDAASREWIVRDPGVIPSAVEEYLRMFAVIASPRVALRDAEYLGCPMKAGDRVWLPVVSANRDERQFPDAGSIILDRPRNRHLAFGTGIHRCLGSHLARAELAIVLRHWHRRIPEYRLATDRESVRHGGQVPGFESLHLEWS